MRDPSQINRKCRYIISVSSLPIFPEVPRRILLTNCCKHPRYFLISKFTPSHVCSPISHCSLHITPSPTPPLPPPSLISHNNQSQMIIHSFLLIQIEFRYQQITIASKQIFDRWFKLKCLIQFLPSSHTPPSHRHVTYHNHRMVADDYVLITQSINSDLRFI